MHSCPPSWARERRLNPSPRFDRCPSQGVARGTKKEGAHLKPTSARALGALGPPGGYSWLQVDLQAPISSITSDGAARPRIARPGRQPNTPGASLPARVPGDRPAVSGIAAEQFARWASPGSEAGHAGQESFGVSACAASEGAGRAAGGLHAAAGLCCKPAGLAA